MPVTALLLSIPLHGGADDAQAAASTAQELVSGTPVKFELGMGQTRTFRLPPGETALYLVEVDQGGLDLKLKHRAPGAKTVVYDFPTGRDDRELVLVEATGDAPQLVTVFMDEFTGAVAQAEIVSTRIEPEDNLLPAYRLLSDAARSNADFDGALTIANLQRAGPLLDRAGATALYARSQFGLATVLAWEAADYENAIPTAVSAEQAYREAGEEALAAAALFLRATCLGEQAAVIEKTPSRSIAPEARVLFDRSLELQAKTLDTQRRLGNRFAAAFILNMMGYTHYSMGDYDRAIEFYGPAAEELGDLQEWGYELWPLQNMGVIDFDRGFLVRAARAFSRGIEILPPGQSNDMRQFLLNNLAGANLELGELDQALAYFSEAGELDEETGERSEYGTALKGIGLTYIRYGETDLGMDYLARAQPVLEQTRSSRGMVSLLNEMGRQYLENGDIEAALDAHRQAERTATMARDRAKAQLGLSEDLVAAGMADRALETLGRAMQAAEDVNSRILRAEVLKRYGDAWLSIERFEEALGAYGEADTIYEALGLAIERSEILFGLSRAYSGLADAESAVQFAVRAIDTVEKHRAGLSTPQLRAFFMARRQDYYAHLIATLVERAAEGAEGNAAFVRQALAYSERSHARSLVDLVNETTRVHSASGRSKERENLLKELADARFRLLGNAEIQLTPAETETTRQRLADIENRLNLLEIERRRANPAYAELVDPTILDAGGIQAMLDADSAILQYALGSAKSVVFLVTQNELRAWPLPGKAQIEARARAIYEKLRLPSTSRQELADLSSLVDAFSRSVLPPADALSQRRLLIVADGVLQYLPFSVLLAAHDGERPEPLSRHEVVNVPSMSVLAAQRENRADRDAPTQTIAIYADPVFSDDDRRLAESSLASPSGGSAAATRRASNRSEPRNLERLPATRFEAETIAKLVAPGSRTVRTGFDASREGVLNANLSDYRFVHFATHGKIDSRYPALSWLAFSQFDPAGDEKSGLVRLHDIYNFRLSAELVTMSACDTALGRQISGEGLTGLVQGFMYSGARAVLASLWQVPDRATAELMGLFYRNLFENDQKPAEALHNAQSELASRSRFRHPYYWSAFVLQGDWN